MPKTTSDCHKYPHISDIASKLDNIQQPRETDRYETVDTITTGNGDDAQVGTSSLGDGRTEAKLQNCE